MTAEPPPDGPARVDVPLDAVLDLLGVLAYGELTGFERMAQDVRLAPSLADKSALARMATAEFGHFELLCNRIRELGADPEAVMEPFRVTFDSFHDSTAPSTWLEGLVKAYVGDGIANDFNREIAAFLDPTTRDLVLMTLTDTGHAAFAVERVRGAVAADPKIAGRLALWARRLVGEALTHSQRVAVDRDAMTSLLGGVGDLAEVGRMLVRITDAHAARMKALGLSG